MYKVRIWIYLRKYALAALGNFLDSLGPIIVLTVGGYLVMQGKTLIGTLVVFNLVLARLPILGTSSSSSIARYLIQPLCTI
jgi:ABC-type bacteriocin/lantibiotic exporter with double-glycine peptidase domain